MSDSVHLRNARALDERNRQNSAATDAVRERVTHLEAQVAMLGSRVESLEQRIIALLASRGAGPTAR